MDAQMAIAIFTALATFAALGTAVAAFCQIKMSRQSISVDALLRLDAHFNSPDMKATRKKAASYLLRQRFNPHSALSDENKCRIALDDLLDFFEGIAFLSMRKGTPDPESVWCFFFHWIDHYYWAAKDYIEQAQKTDPLRWRDFVDFRKHLVSIENKHRKKYEPPDKDQLRRFLEDEAKLSM